jgi:adenosine/AMP kinase
VLKQIFLHLSRTYLQHILPSAELNLQPSSFCTVVCENPSTARRTTNGQLVAGTGQVSKIICQNDQQDTHSFLINLVQPLSYPLNVSNQQVHQQEVTSVHTAYAILSCMYVMSRR